MMMITKTPTYKDIAEFVEKFGLAADPTRYVDVSGNPLSANVVRVLQWLQSLARE